jgi:hypothetical protein
MPFFLSSKFEKTKNKKASDKEKIIMVTKAWETRKKSFLNHATGIERQV